jgi:dynein regulatory complex protein 1
MQILEKCMEDMKAVYRLNEEKLEFNRKVLTERETVNLTTQKQLKIRKRHYVDLVRKVIIKFNNNQKES